MARGKVQVGIAIERAPGAAATSIDQKAAADFLQQARALQKKLKITGEVTLKPCLAAPGVLKIGRRLGPGSLAAGKKRWASLWTPC